MTTVAKAAIAIALSGGLAMSAQQLRSNSSPLATIREFCEMDAGGKRLTPDGVAEMDRLFGEHRQATRAYRIAIIRKYDIKPLRVSGDSAEFEVDYDVWGYLEESGQFKLLERAQVGQPVRRRETVPLVRSDKHLMFRADGKIDEIKGATIWRVGFPAEPHVYVKTALGYLGHLRAESIDPDVKAKVGNSLSVLAALSATGGGGQQTPPRQSAWRVLSDYCALESVGNGGTGERDGALMRFLVKPMQRKSRNIAVVASFAVSDVVIAEGRAEAYVEYRAVGRLDSQLRFTSGEGKNASSGEVAGENYRIPYKLIVIGMDEEIHGKGDVRERQSHTEWRIEEREPEEWMTIDAAIRMLEADGYRSGDAGVIANAKKSVTLLKGLRAALQ